MKQALEPIVNEELGPLGLELVELKVGGSKSRPVLDIRIDRLDRAKVQVGDCERASRAIEARLDALPAVIDGRYVLEVSSPGMDRPLRSLADFERFVGRKVVLKHPDFAAIGGKVEVEIAGTVAANGTAPTGAVLVTDAKGVVHTLAMDGISDARLAFHWKP